MTDKAYIVANKQQEMSVLEKLESEGYRWFDNEEPTEWVPSRDDICFGKFPLALISHKNKYVLKNLMQDNFELNILERCEVAFDGRKEDNMSEKYVVSQEFMKGLEDWKASLPSSGYKHKPFVGWINIKNLPETLLMWWGDDGFTDEEKNNRLIAILRWVNGEDVFEVEEPKKWVVRSKETSSEGSHLYVNLSMDIAIPNITRYFGIRSSATRFDTKEEAESWANSHQEVIEVDK